MDVERKKKDTKLADHEGARQSLWGRGRRFKVNIEASIQQENGNGFVSKTLC
jgi:hypothetical protein